MSTLARAVFGAHGQAAVGTVFLGVSLGQWAYWGLVAPATVGVVFHVSMEALVFASYAVVATALGYRATERVEEHVINQEDSP